MAKRRFISFLPDWNQTDDLSSFFGTTVDEVFQPGTSEPISGYIGRKPATLGIQYTTIGDVPTGSTHLTVISTAAIQVGQAVSGANIDTNTYIVAQTDTIIALNKGVIGPVPDGTTILLDDATDFYVNEPTASRVAYQLESGMISLDTTGAINNALTYPDFISYLSSEGANVTNQQRLFDTEYYSWAPPINLDALVNYNQYYWFGDETGKSALPVLVLTIPVLAYTGDGFTTTYALPASIDAVSIGDETPTVYVDGLPVAFTLSSNSVVLHVTPGLGSGILVARVYNFVVTTTGKTAVNVTDINTEGVTKLSSGMRVQIIDMFAVTGDWDEAPLDTTLWDAGGTNVYLVDGVGLGVRYTSDDELLYDVEAQYVTIDRSSAQTNLWSFHNVWVHKDSFAWSGQQFLARKAVRPIVEFVRDIVLYPGQIWSESIDPLFMLYDLEGRPLNDPGFYPGSDFAGNRIFGYATGSAPPDPILLRSLSFDANDYIIFAVDAAAISYTFISGSISEPIAGLACYQLDDGVDTPITPPLWHLATTTTNQGETNGFFDVPLNLQANPTSQDVTTISQSTWVGQFQSIIGSQIGLIGNALGDNNYRDTARDLDLGDAILQHRAPLLKAMLLASNTLLDLPQAIQYADQEYTKFRNKFARKLVDLNNRGVMQGIDPTVDPTEWVLTALSELNRSLNATFPFALNTIGGGQYFIPPTPSALGVLPAAVPTMLTDTTYFSPVVMLQGHDGSLSPAFNDWRDNVILQLETMIYTNLPSQLQTEARPGFDIQQWIGTRFFAPFNGYTRQEITAILTPAFELWAQQNRVDYRTNSTYDSGNPFTWNYSGVLDRFGDALPGNWRAIYLWYYGTDSPHTRPWEMLGFVSQPSWWVTTYGAAPYTRSNTTLWDDLETGTIAAGPRAGTDQTYARAGLIDLIPVDDNGVLLNPIQAGIVNVNVSFDVGSAPWQVGDDGPVENLWTISSAYRYALAAAAFLMKPARFVEECWDVLNIGYVGDQWVELATSPRPPFARPQNSQQYVFGEIAPGGVVSRITGITQWISDFLVSAGQNITGVFGGSVRTLDVRLIHQMAGFVSLDDVQALADNFGLVPTENINSILYTSSVQSSEVYSGAILEWTGRSWRLIGYDARTPFFTIIPGDPNGPKGIISLATAPEPSIVEWHSNTYYPVNILALYLNSVYECARSHTSGPRFEMTFWTLRPDLAASMVQAPRVITYANGLNTTQQVAYGTEYTTFQSVADVLLGWERWLLSRGWSFDTVDPTSGLVRNWNLAVKEFLTWAQVKWAPGNFIALSPGMQGLEFSTETGTILNVESSFTGFFGLLDRAGQPITSRKAIINRLDGEITMSAQDADIFCARLNLVEIEHALVFDNTTIFDDNVYLPLFNLRQPRLRLICNRSTDWAGRLDAPGFVIIGNLLRSDFDKAADDVRLMFDIELADRTVLREYARHVVGFQTRDYLENLLVSDVEQFEFYQGMISQKGAPGVFQKLMRSNRASDNSDLLFLEEWAIRLGEFGAPIDPFFTFALLQGDMRDDPQLIRFAPTNDAPRDWLIIASPSDSRWVDLPPSMAFFPLLTNYPPPAVPTAGPVRLSDVLYTAFTLDDVPGIYLQEFDAGTTPFPTGSSTWVYERADGTFTVLRSFETGATPNAILKVTSVAEDVTVTTSRIYFQQPMTLTVADVGSYLVVDGLSLTNSDLQGVQVIIDINIASNYVDLVAVLTAGYDFAFNQALDTAPLVRVLREVRFANLAALTAARYAFAQGDLAWIDNDGNGHWQVLFWNTILWAVTRSQPARTDSRPISETVVYEMGTTVTDQQMFIDEPVVDDVVVIDPLVGLIAGIADREIDFKTAYDPAQYNAGLFGSSANPWGANQVGRVWWNLATIKFLDPFTDVIGAGDARDATELAYRLANWSRIAPNTSVDVYEWIVSTVDPTTYATLALSDTTGMFKGTVYHTATPSWAQTSTVDPLTGQLVTKYYFWVAGLTVTPVVPFRHMDISSVALAIENPSALNLSWLAPIHSDCLIVSGVLQFLDNTSTVLKVRMTFNPDNMGRHNEWLLMRPGDETSLPPDLLWQQLRDSLGGFNDYMQVLPNPRLTPARSTGIYRGQNMFIVPNADGELGGLLAARASFVGIINNILAANPVAIQRQSFVSTLFRSTPINQSLIWSQPDESYVFEPPPRNEWDIQVYTIAERNRLLSRPEFVVGDQVRVLLNGIGEPTQRWSIWVYNAQGIGWDEAAWEGNWDSQPAVTDSGFSLATSYDQVVDTPAERDALVTPAIIIGVGTRVLVNSDALGFWVIWKWMGTPASGNPVDGFVLWRTQSYRTGDFIAYVDWYASGYSAASPPVVSYPTMAARNLTEGATPTNLFVKVNDNGHGIWIWTVWDAVALQWDTVAYQNGTLALGDGTNTADNFLDPTRQDIWSLLFGWDDAEWDGDGWDIAIASLTTALTDQIADRDGSWELRVLTQALRYGGLLLDSEVNETFFSMLNFVHAQQNEVDWAFKTSFMSLLGYNVPLQQTPVLVQDTTPSLISYIDEVKPYHVKVRQYSTQYNPDIDATTVHATDFDKPVYLDPVTNKYRVLDPNNASDLSILQLSEPWKDWYPVRGEALVRSFDMTLLFDRVTDSVAMGWGETPWDSLGWDNHETAKNNVYVHTTVNTSLTSPSATIKVDDIRFIQAQWTDDIRTPVTPANPLQVTINKHVYFVGIVTPDVTNISTTRGFSGSLTTVSGNFLVSDGTSGNLVEVTMPQPVASRRIFDYYAPTSEMPPNNLTLLLDLDVRGATISYLTEAAVASGGTLLTFVSTLGLALNVPVAGPFIVKGTTVTDVSSTTVTLSAPVIGAIPAGATIVFDLPNAIDGYILNAFSAPGSFDIGGFDSIDFDENTGVLDVAYDGGINPLDPSTIVTDINPPLPSRPGGLDLRAPYYAADHPQERLPFTSDDGLRMTVTALPLPGGPSQIIKEFFVGALTGTTTLFFDLVAHASDAVLVFRDGVRANLNSDYTVDYFHRTVTVNLFSGLEKVLIHVFGFGGTSTIDNRYYYAYASNPLVIDQISTTADTRVVVGGTALTGGEYTVSGTNVTLTSPPSVGADVAIMLYDGGISTATEIQFQTLTYNGMQTWTLNPFDAQSAPVHSGTFVEVNGERLIPPTTFYGEITPSQPYMLLPISPGGGDDITLYVNGTEYLSVSLPVCTTTDPSSPYPFKVVVPTPPPAPATPALLVLFDGLLISLNPFYAGNVAITFVPASNPPPDFIITSSGVLTIYKTLSPSDQIIVYSFSNAASMGWETVTYPIVGFTYFVPIPFAPDYAMVTLDGLEIAPQVDYEIVDTTLGWDSLPLDAVPLDLAYIGSELLLFNPGSAANVTASFCTAQAAREEMQWMTNTVTPAFARMPMDLDNSGHQTTGVPTHGSIVTPQPQFDSRFGYLRLSPYLAGTLAATLAPDATSIVANLLLRPISPKLEPAFPLPNVYVANDPGVVWINNERIEYFGFSQSGSVVTLTGLRRGTQGTSIQEQRNVSYVVGNGAQTSYVMSNAIGPVEVFINDFALPADAFTTVVSGGDTIVTLTAAHGTSVTLAITTGFTYATGAQVFNGKAGFTLPVPLGTPCGNRELLPMHQIIAG